VVRAISHALLSVIMIATLLCGGCISCPQFFMFPGMTRDCCKAGHCERSQSQKNGPSKDCKRMQLEPASSSQIHTAAPALIPITIEVAAPVVLSSSPIQTVLRMEHSPPDLQALNATFLI
jgi:hypothetical protein